MTFRELQDAVLHNRFDESDRASVKNWINTRYNWLWTQEEWSFKYVTAVDLSVTSTNATPNMPSDFARSTALYDDQGTPLDYILPRQWEETALPIGQSGATRSDRYTVIDRQLYLWPQPSDATYKLSYKRRLSHVDAIAGVVGGIMSADSDQPLWPAEHDYVLVLDAAMLGKPLISDPTWTMLREQRDELFQAMRKDLILDSDGAPEQWGRDYVC